MTFKCGQCETDLCPVCGNMMAKNGKATQMCVECGYMSEKCPSCEGEQVRLACSGCGTPQGLVKRGGIMGTLGGGLIGRGIGKLTGLPGLGLMGMGLGHFTQKALERPPAPEVNIANSHSAHVEKQANCGHCQNGHEVEASLIIAAKGCPNCGGMMCPFCRSHIPEGQSVCTECGFMGSACGGCGHDQVNSTCNTCGEDVGLIKRGAWQAAALALVPYAVEAYKAKKQTQTPVAPNITVNKMIAPTPTPATARALYDLVQLANQLDEKGLVKEANKIDQLLENTTVHEL